MTKTYIVSEETLRDIVCAAIACGEEMGESGETSAIRAILRDSAQDDAVRMALTWSEQTGRLCVPIQDVVLLTNRNGADCISIKLADEMARAIHGENYPNWQEAHLDLRCGHGLGEQALSALGLVADRVFDMMRDSREKFARQGSE